MTTNKAFIYYITIPILLVPLFLAGQRKAIRQAEMAIDNNEFYIAKKYLEEAAPTVAEQNKSVLARYYMAKGMIYLTLNADNYGSLEGLKEAQASFKKVIELGRKADGKRGLEAVEEAVLQNAILDREEEDYKNAYQKFYNLAQLYPKDTVYLFAAASNAFQTETMDDRAIALFEELKEMQYRGRTIQYMAKNKISGDYQLFKDKEQRDKYLKAGYFEAPKDEKSTSQEGKVIRFLIELYARNNQEDKAKELLNSVSDDPNDIDLYRDLAFAHKALGNNEEYKTHLSTLIEEDAKNEASYLVLLGEEMEENDQVEKAKTYYEEAIKTDPESEQAYLNLAQLFLNKGGQVAKDLKKLEESKDKQSDTYQSLENQQKELLKKALPYLEKSFELDPENINVLRALHQTNWVLENEKGVRKYGKLLKAANQSQNKRTTDN